MQGVSSYRELQQLIRLLPPIILLVGGFGRALPDYQWARPAQVVHGVFVDDVLLGLYLLLAAIDGRLLVLRTGSTPFVFLTFCLGVVGLSSALVNQSGARDVGEALRVLLYVCYFVLAVQWSWERGYTFVLRWYLLGVAAGGLVNLYYSIADPYLVLQGLPILRARNGAGGVLALSIGLAAWLWLTRRTQGDTAVATLTLLVGTIAISISYSRTAIVIGSLGLAAWAIVLSRHVFLRPSRRMRFAALLGLILAVVYVTQSESGSQRLASARRLVEIKFANLDVEDTYSLGARYMYLWAVLEIVGENPLAGVGYSGFYGALRETEPYRSARMLEEDRYSTSANPHNSFLYYAAANGVPGLAIAVLLYLTMVRAMWRSLKGHGFSGLAVTVCIAGAVFIYANTLPSLFRMELFYVPVAAAMCHAAVTSQPRWVRPRRVIDPAAIAVGNFNPGGAAHRLSART